MCQVCFCMLYGVFQLPVSPAKQEIAWLRAKQGHRTVPRGARPPESGQSVLGAPCPNSSYTDFWDSGRIRSSKSLKFLAWEYICEMATFSRIHQHKKGDSLWPGGPGIPGA